MNISDELLEYVAEVFLEKDHVQHYTGKNETFHAFLIRWCELRLRARSTG